MIKQFTVIIYIICRYNLETDETPRSGEILRWGEI